MILGLSLVVQELHKGPRLVFRYPDEGSVYYQRSFQSVLGDGVRSTVQFGFGDETDDGEAVLTNATGAVREDLLCHESNPAHHLRAAHPFLNPQGNRNGQRNSNPASGLAAAAAAAAAARPKQVSSDSALLLNRIYQQYFGLTDEHFAKLFRAKPALVNHILDLTIDDIRYLSLPCACPLAADAALHSASSVANAGGSAASVVAAATSAMESTLSTGMNTSTTETPAVTTDSVGTDQKHTHSDGAGESTSETPLASNLSRNETSADVISVFNIVIATISGKAMRKILKTFQYRCQCKMATAPGENPITAALGLRNFNYGICRQTLRRVLEVATEGLLAQERKYGYITSQVSLMLQIIDSHATAFACGPNGNLGVSGITNTGNGTNSAVGGNFRGSSAANNQIFDPEVAVVVADDDIDGVSAVAVVEFGRTMRSASNVSTNSANNANNLLNNEVDSVDSDQSSSNMGKGRFQSRFKTAQSSLVLNTALVKSTLANELRILFHALTGGHSANIQFNQSKAVNVALACKELKLCEETQTLLGSSLSAPHTIHVVGVANEDLSRPGGSSHETAKIKGISLNTQTVLTMATTDSIINILGFLDGTNINCGQHVNMQNDHKNLTNSRLYSFIEAVDPTKSFIDLSLELDEPVEELISMANYLRSWGLAEIIPLIYQQNCYMVHPSAPLRPFSTAARAFEMLILSFGIVECLAHSRRRSRLNRANSRSGPMMSDDGLSSRKNVTRIPFLPHNTSFPRESSDFPDMPHLDHMRSDARDSDRAGSEIGDGVEDVIELEYHSELRTEYSLPSILALFDGDLTLNKIFPLLPEPLQQYGIDVIVFLLQWHLVVPVNSYLVNMLAIPAAAPDFISAPSEPVRPPSTARNGFSVFAGSSLLSSSLIDNRGLLGGDRWSDQRSKSNLSLQFGMIGQHELQSDDDSSFAPHGVCHELLSTLPYQYRENHWVQGLSLEDLQTFERIIPHIDGLAVSHKSVNELLWVCRVSENDLERLLSRIPFLSIVKKVS